jgi:hypothetical protein
MSNKGYSQHFLKTILDDSPRTDINQVSFMDEGLIDNNFIQFVAIPANYDGELTFAVDDFKANNDINFQFRNKNNGDIYRIRLNDFLVEIEDVSVNQVGEFSNNDFFKIVRCQNFIFYYHNDNLIQTFELVDNNFTILGEVIINDADNVMVDLTFNAL